MNKNNRRITVGIAVGVFLIVVLYFFVGIGKKTSWPVNRAGLGSGLRTVMGTLARVIAVAEDSGTAKKGIEVAYQQLDSVELLVSVHRDDSQISEINRSAHKDAVQISEPTFEVLQKALELSKLSDGAFDITVGALSELWRLADEANSVPTDNELAEARFRVGYKKLILDANDMSVRFTVDGMKLDAGGIAKGYAIDKAVEAMQAAGAIGGMVNVGGDIRVFGAPPPGAENWLIGLQDPRDTKTTVGTGRYLLTLDLMDSAVATSGDYRRFAWIEGKKHSHIIDTKTGYGSDNLASVTVICENATDADALATAVSVMGAEKGLALIESIPQTEAILISSQPQYKIIKTTGAEKYISR